MYVFALCVIRTLLVILNTLPEFGVTLYAWINLSRELSETVKGQASYNNKLADEETIKKQSMTHLQGFEQSRQRLSSRRSIHEGYVSIIEFIVTLSLTCTARPQLNNFHFGPLNCSLKHQIMRMIKELSGKSLVWSKGVEKVDVLLRSNTADELTTTCRMVEPRLPSLELS